MIENLLELIGARRLRVIGWRQLTDGSWRASLTDYQAIWASADGPTAAAALGTALAKALKPPAVAEPVQTVAMSAEEMDL